jgi:hypothetical protein
MVSKLKSSQFIVFILLISKAFTIAMILEHNLLSVFSKRV